MSQPFERNFPQLAAQGYEITSPPDRRYNCIAWAAGDQTRWWWPDLGECGFWPENAPRELSLVAFIAAFASVGYARCATGNSEAGLEKLALYVLNGRPTHAARQLADGWWTSKCGRSEDIRHTLEGLTGDLYGEPEVFLSRPRLTSEP